MLTQLTFHLRERKVVEELKNHNQHLSKAALRAKFQTMSLSPYRFYQETNHLYWHDFYNDWRLSLFGGIEHTQTWLQGDAHVYNFSSYPDRMGRPTFGMDEFDSAMVGDYQYDLWSLGISIILNCGANAFFSFDQASQAVRVMAKAYWKVLMAHALNEPVKLSQTPKLSQELQRFLKKIGKKQTIKNFYKQWVETLPNGNRAFSQKLPFLEPLNAKNKALFLAIFADYQRDAWFDHDALRQFKVLDVAHLKTEGASCVETDRLFVLIGNANKHLKVLDIKEQHLPPACQFMTDAELRRYRQIFPNEGLRHEQAFCAISGHPDPFLGWMEYSGRIYSIRELSPLKQFFDTSTIKKFKAYNNMAKAWGRLLAVEHLRGARTLFGDNGMPFAQAFAIVAEHQDTFLDMVQDISESYANCVVNDYEVFLLEFSADYV